MGDLPSDLEWKRDDGGIHGGLPHRLRFTEAARKGRGWRIGEAARKYQVRVMIDHADRAIEGLKREAEQIRRDTTA